MWDDKRIRTATAFATLLAVLAGCSTAFNPLPEAPDVRIVESERVTLASGAVPAAGITLTDSVSGAAVSIPGGAVITLDASPADDIPAVTPASIIVTLRPISQFLANQNGDFLDGSGTNINNIHKVGALAVLPVIGRSTADITLTIPINTTATGELTVWRFIPDDEENSDGLLTALPSNGHWRIFEDGVAAVSNRVTVITDTFGQYIVTTSTATTDPTNMPPVAALSADPLSGPAPLTVTFSAAGSTDSDGTIIRYEWDFDGDGTFGDPTTTPTTTHIYDAATDGQSFVAAVKVFDDDDAESATATVTILVGEQSPVITRLEPPTAVVDVETTFTLTATDADGEIADIAWNFDDNADFEVPGGTALTIAHTFDAVGPVEIGVQVTDDDGNIATQVFSITVTDGAAAGPVTLNATPSPATLGETTPATVLFTTVLDPPAITFSSVVYDFGDSTTPVTETDTPLEISHDYATVGTFTATVTVTPTTGDPPVDGTPVTDSVVVVVNPFDGGGGGDPTATLTATPASGDLNAQDELEVTFTTTLTPATLDFSEVAYRFEDTGNFVVETESPLSASHTYTEAGTYAATVRITPVDGEQFTTTATVTVSGNAPPVASFLSGAAGSNPLLYTFNASGSTDDGAIVDYDWDFGDGSAHGFGANAQHAYAGPGTYNVVLTVTDNGTPPRSDTALATITIAP